MPHNLSWDDDAEVLDWDNPPSEPIVISEPKPEVTQERATQIWLDFLHKYDTRPDLFAEEVLGIELMQHQREILQAVGAKNRRIAMRSGHRVGKTTLLAIVSLWHLVTKYPQKTIVTAPTAGQLFDALYPEIKSMARKLPKFIYDLFDWLTEEIKLKADPDGSFLSARTASPENAESFQGIHSANVLFIWDEASGIDERLFSAARGSMAAPNAIQMLAGNPVRLNNTFHRAFTVNATLYTKFHISSVKVRVQDAERIPDILASCLPTVDPDFVQEIIQTFGIESNEYRIRILGEFPDTEDESYIPATLVRAARARDIKPAPLSAVVYGVDPARKGGDRTVITRKIGLHVIDKQYVHIKKDTMQIVGEIVNLAEQDRNRLIKEFKDAGRPLLFLPPVPAAIVVDVIGIGAGIVDRLRELDFNVIEVNVSETTTSEPLCYRLRDAMYKKFKEWLASGLCKLPDDEELQIELTAPHYTYNSAGVLKIESKDEVKKRTQGRSPDKADSAMLTILAPPDVVTGFLTNASGGHIGYGSGPKGRLVRASGAPTTR